MSCSKPAPHSSQWVSYCSPFTEGRRLSRTEHKRLVKQYRMIRDPLVHFLTCSHGDTTKCGVGWIHGADCHRLFYSCDRSAFRHFLQQFVCSKYENGGWSAVLFCRSAIHIIMSHSSLHWLSYLSSLHDVCMGTVCVARKLGENCALGKTSPWS